MSKIFVSKLFVFITKIYCCQYKENVIVSEPLFPQLCRSGFFDTFFKLVDKFKGTHTIFRNQFVDNPRNRSKVYFQLKIIIRQNTSLEEVIGSFEEWCDQNGLQAIYIDVVDIFKISPQLSQPLLNVKVPPAGEFADPPAYKPITLEDQPVPIDELPPAEQEEPIAAEDPPLLNVEAPLYAQYVYSADTNDIEILGKNNNIEINDVIILPINYFQSPIQTEGPDTPEVETCTFNSSSLSRFHLSASLLSSTKFTNLTKLSDVNVTADSDQVEEYKVIRKKRAIAKEPTQNVSLHKEKQDVNNLKKPRAYYKYQIGSLKITKLEEMYLEEHFPNGPNEVNKLEFLMYVEDIVRESYKSINNVCPINYTSHRIFDDKSAVSLYAKCIYEYIGCRRYKFLIKLNLDPIVIEVFTDRQTKLTHSVCAKIQQVRAVRRKLALDEVKNEFASNYRNKKLTQMSTALRDVGNMGDVISNDVARKIKSESLRRFDRDKDPVIDVLYMQRDKKWSSFIQRISIPQEIYLFSRDQLNLSQLNKRMFLKLSKNSLFLDSTGGIVSKFNKDSKRVFLYSIVLHVRDENGKGILIPLAEALTCSHYEEDVKRFLMDVKVFCIKNCIKWPICRRVVVDWSWALINASLKTFNSDVSSVNSYLMKCFLLLSKKNDTLKFVIVQICYCHFIKIVIKDIELVATNDDQIRLFKSLLIKAINISNFDEIWVWFESICVISLSPVKNKTFELAMKRIFALDISVFIELETLEKESIYNTNQSKTNYSKSPFYKKALQIFFKTKNKINNSGLNGSCNVYKNEKFLNLLLTKYMPYVVLWSNLMGKYVDSNNSRISNSPVEGYFSIVKNILLKGKRNVRASEYIRMSKEYCHAKIRELDNKYNVKDKGLKRKKNDSVLLEEFWKKTPKKLKKNINLKMVQGEKIIQNINYYYSSNNLPRKLRNKKFFIGEYRQIFLYTYEVLSGFHSPVLYLHEFESLNPPSKRATGLLWNGLFEIYIHILIYELNIQNIEVCTCEEGEGIFFTNIDYEFKNIFKFQSGSTIIIPILHNDHYTCFYVKVEEKEFTYLDPFGESEAMISMISKKFFEILTKMGLNVDGWKHVKIDHATQSDSFNCGVYCSEFIEALLKKNSNLCDILNPNEYRQVMKNKLMSYTKDMSDECLHCEGIANVLFLKCSQCSRSICVGCLNEHYGINSIENISVQCFVCEYGVKISH